MRHAVTLSLAIVSALSVTAQAQYQTQGVAPACTEGFQFGQFSGGDVALVGAADIDIPSLVLTPDQPDLAGAAWYPEQANVRNGFVTEFTFRITPATGGGDGMAFVIQNDNPAAIGGNGSGMGYSGILNSLAVEFDTLSFGGEHQTPHVAVQTQGAAPNDHANFATISHALAPGFHNAQLHTCRIVYVPGQMDIYLDDLVNPMLTVAVDLTNINGDDILFGGDCAWIGFTAGTGSATDAHKVESWLFSNGEFCAEQFSIDEFVGVEVVLNGDAGINDPELEITPAQSGKHGSAWYPNKVRVADGFDTRFDFNITPSGGGDGMAFVIQNEGSAALGGTGSALGYGDEGNPGIQKSLAIELDTFVFGGEFADNHISIQSRGNNANSSEDVDSLAHAEPGIPLDNGQTHTCRITYLPGEMKVYLDNLNTPVLTANIDLHDIDGDDILDGTGCVFVGFTAGTGGANASHRVESWSFRQGRSVTEWRSTREHDNVGQLAIVIDPNASGNGLNGPTVESRVDGILRIELDFNASVHIVDTNNFSVVGRTTTNGVLEPEQDYFSISQSSSSQFVAFNFDPGHLPDRTCYDVSILDGLFQESILRHNSVHVRALEGDTTGNGALNLGDVLATKKRASVSTSAVNDPRYDFNLSGNNINMNDALLIKALIDSPADEALCE